MPKPDAPRLCRVAGRDTWHIYYQRRRISTGCTDRTKAEIVLARFIEGDVRQNDATHSISRILDLYLRDRKEAAIPGHERLDWAHRRLKAYFRERPAEVVSEEECRAYRASRHKDGVTDSTARTELQALRAAPAFRRRVAHVLFQAHFRLMHNLFVTFYARKSAIFNYARVHVSTGELLPGFCLKTQKPPRFPGSG